MHTCPTPFWYVTAIDRWNGTRMVLWYADRPSWPNHLLDHIPIGFQEILIHFCTRVQCFLLIYKGGRTSKVSGKDGAAA